MIKTLVKKQLSELFSTMFGRSAFGKNGKKKSGKGMIALYVFLLIYVFGVFSFLFYETASLFFVSFAPLKLEWLAFALLSVAATGFGVIGTVFTTNSALYNAKDNDLLLSLPIKPWQIIFARVFTLYIMDFFYEAMIIIPSFVAYVVCGNVSPAVIICGIAVLFALPLLSLAISLVLGFLIALVSGRIKNKSLVTMVLSIGFILAYFYLISEMQNYITMLVANGEIIAENIKAFAYPVYALGMACTGDMLGLLIFLACVLVIFAIVYYILSISFLKLATMKRGGKKAVYREKTYKEGSVNAALFKKELARFWASPVYMLNSSVGSIFMIIAAVFLIIEGKSITEIFSAIPEVKEFAPLIVSAVICGTASMNVITAPSVSLEGNNIWLLRSLPVPAWNILMSKVLLHMVISGVPTFIFAIVCVFVLPMDAAALTLVPMIAIISNLMFALLGLAINLKHPSFDWTNEAVPVKQGMSVLLTMLSGMGIMFFFVIVYVILFFAAKIAVMASMYLLCAMLVCFAATALLYAWICKRGTKIFESF